MLHVILLCGPTSSGKTTLMKYIVDSMSGQITSIAKKRIVYELRDAMEQEYFGDLIKELSSITRNKVTSLEQFFLELDSSTYTQDVVRRLDKIKQSVLEPV